MEYIKEMLQEAGLSKTEASEIAKENKGFAAWLKKQCVRWMRSA